MNDITKLFSSQYICVTASASLLAAVLWYVVGPLAVGGLLALLVAIAVSVGAMYAVGRFIIGPSGDTSGTLLVGFMFTFLLLFCGLIWFAAMNPDSRVSVEPISFGNFVLLLMSLAALSFCFTRKAMIHLPDVAAVLIFMTSMVASSLGVVFVLSLKKLLFASLG